mmetsp:Transcript_39482/g.73609  ORF Transcript_39482/g.73609 Transcript_39482/m.73609 type:complete len:131 (-) Transcript_39482:70-462(-)
MVHQGANWLVFLALTQVNIAAASWNGHWSGQEYNKDLSSTHNDAWVDLHVDGTGVYVPCSGCDGRSLHRLEETGSYWYGGMDWGAGAFHCTFSEGDAVFCSFTDYAFKGQKSEKLQSRINVDLANSTVVA